MTDSRSRAKVCLALRCARGLHEDRPLTKARQSIRETPAAAEKEPSVPRSRTSREYTFSGYVPRLDVEQNDPLAFHDCGDFDPATKRLQRICAGSTSDGRAALPHARAVAGSSTRGEQRRPGFFRCSRAMRAASSRAPRMLGRRGGGSVASTGLDCDREVGPLCGPLDVRHHVTRLLQQPPDFAGHRTSSPDENYLERPTPHSAEPFPTVA